MALLGRAKIGIHVTTGALAFAAFYRILHWAPDDNASDTFLIAQMVYCVAGLLLDDGAPLIRSVFVTKSVRPTEEPVIGITDRLITTQFIVSGPGAPSLSGAGARGAATSRQLTCWYRPSESARRTAN
jgi:hypothetical protein